MLSDYVMPAIAEAGAEVTIVAWHKKAGDVVTVGEVLLEVMTEKVNVEVESTLGGRIVEILSAQDSQVQAGDVIARVETR